MMPDVSSKTLHAATRQNFVQQSSLLALAALGGLSLGLLGVPAGFMSGGMILVASTAVFGNVISLKITPMSAILRRLAILLSGISMGSGVTPETLAQLWHYPISILFMMACVVSVTFFSSRLLLKLPEFSNVTALFASIPGSLTYVLAYAAQTKADVSKVAAIQSFRIFFLMAVLPLIIAQTSTHSVTQNAVQTPMFWAPVLIILGYLCGRGLEFCNIGTHGLGLFYGATLVSATLHGFDYVPGRLPLWWQAISQILVGAWVGGRFIGMEFAQLRKAFVVSGVSLLVTLAISAIFALTTALLLDLPFGKVLLAFAPGGIEAITMLSYALNLDPLFVGTHHIFRVFLISFSLPVLMNALNRNQAACCQSSGASSGSSS